MNALSIRFYILAIAAFCPSAQACMCFNPERPCDNDHEVAFVGHVARVQKLGDGSESKLRVHLLVREAFRGTESSEVDVLTPATSCGIAFIEGQDYLVFANKNAGPGILEAHGCSGTKLASMSEQELEHLRAVAKGENRSGVYGFVTANPWDFVRASKPVANVPIQLSSGRELRRGLTDAEGKYEFGLLSPGRYQILAELMNVPERQRSFKVEIPAGACRMLPFLSVPVGRISGRLVDSAKRPVAGVLVEIEAILPTPQPHPLLKTPTDAQGRFVHERLEAGKYVLGINLASSRRDYLGKPSRYPRTYYPGVANRVEARPVGLEAGQNIDDLQFLLPNSK